MARKKKDPQLTESPNSENEQPVEKEKTGRNKSIPAQDDVMNEVTPSGSKNKKKKAGSPEENSSGTKEKKASKTKTGKEDNAASAQPEESQTNDLEASEVKPVKKIAKRKSALKKEITQQDDPLVQEPVSFAEATPGVVEHLEPVTVAEEKNEAFVHRLAHHHHQPIAEQPDKIENEVEETKNGNEEIKDNDVKNNEESKGTQLRFILNYYTKPGQILFVTAHHPLFGNGNAGAALPMQFLDSQHWTAEIFINENELTEDVGYKYLLKEEDGSFVYDGSKDKKIQPSLYKSKNITLIDAWDFEGYYDNAFFTEPFTKVLFKNNQPFFENKQPETYTHLFKIKAPLLVQGQVVCLTGSSGSLTNWSTSEPLLLNKKIE